MIPGETIDPRDARDIDMPGVPGNHRDLETRIHRYPRDPRDVNVPVVPGDPRDPRDIDIPGVPGDPRDPRDIPPRL